MSSSDLSANTNFLLLSQGRVAYTDAGSGPLLVLIPGMGDSRQSYRFLEPLLLAYGYRVVSMDLRGHGDSDATFRAYGSEATSDDILKLINVLGEPAIVVGNSMSAGSAVLAAAAAPEQVRGIVLIGPFVRQPASDSWVQRALMRVALAPPWGRKVWNGYFATLFAGRKPDDFDAYRARVHEEMSRPGHFRAFRETAKTTHRAASHALKHVTCPALVIMGDADPDFPSPETEAAWIAAELGARYVMVRHAGHYPQAQQPLETGAAIEAFLQTVVGTDG